MTGPATLSIAWRATAKGASANFALAPYSLIHLSCIQPKSSCRYLYGFLGNTQTGTGIARNGCCHIEAVCNLCGEYQKQPGSCGDRNV